jgi:multiple sugar transport system permease protein
MTKRSVAPFLLLLPALAIVVGVSFAPIYYAVDMSLHETKFLQKTAFIGLQQYARLLHNNDFLRGLATSIKYGIGSLLLTIPIGMLFAILLNRDIRFRAVFRTILIIPWTLSQSVTAMLWVWMLNPSYGPAKYLLGQIGISQTSFLSNPDWALTNVILVNSWMTYSFPTVLFLAALQTVPRELYESATIDGCSHWSSFWRVTLPYIRNTIMSTTIMLTLQFFNMVTLIYVLTGGGPMGTTRTLSLLVFQDGFVNFRVGTAAATGLVIFLLNIVFSLAYIRVLRQSELY